MVVIARARVSLSFSLEGGGQLVAAEPASQVRPTDRTYRHVVVMAPEVDLVAGFDAQLVAQRLWDHDLALRADTMSHTIEYNRATSTTSAFWHARHSPGDRLHASEGHSA